MACRVYYCTLLGVNGLLCLVDSLQCLVEQLVILFMCCHIFPLQLCITPNALVLAWYHSIETLGTDMLTDLLTFEGVPTSSIWAGNDLLPTLPIMDLFDEGIWALLATVFTLVISVGTGVLPDLSSRGTYRHRYHLCTVLGRELE